MRSTRQAYRLGSALKNFSDRLRYNVIPKRTHQCQPIATARSGIAAIVERDYRSRSPDHRNDRLAALCPSDHTRVWITILDDLARDRLRAICMAGNQ